MSCLVGKLLADGAGWLLWRGLIEPQRFSALCGSRSGTTGAGRAPGSAPWIIRGFSRVSCLDMVGPVTRAQSCAGTVDVFRLSRAQMQTWALEFPNQRGHKAPKKSTPAQPCMPVCPELQIITCSEGMGRRDASPHHFPAAFARLHHSSCPACDWERGAAFELIVTLVSMHRSRQQCMLTALVRAVSQPLPMWGRRMTGPDLFRVPRSPPKTQLEGPYWPWEWAGARRMGTAPGTVLTKWPICHYNKPRWHFPTAGESLLVTARWDRKGTPPRAPKSCITQHNKGDIRMVWSRFTVAKPGPEPPGSVGGSSFRTRPRYQEVAWSSLGPAWSSPTRGATLPSKG